MEQKRYPKGHFVGLGYAIGMPLCIVIGFVTDNISMGIVFGVALGVPIGAALEKKYNPNPRPLTEEVKKGSKTKFNNCLRYWSYYVNCRHCNIFFCKIILKSANLSDLR